MRRGEGPPGHGRRTRLAVGIGGAAAGALVLVGLPGFGASAPAVHVKRAAVTTVPPTTVPPTTTTVPASTTTTAAPKPAPPAPTPQPAPAPPPPASAARQGILPPQEPPTNISPSPDFLQSCSGSQYDDSPGCVDATVQAIDNARAHEGLAGLSLPSNWYQLSVTQQLYVSTNLERTVRGLAPLVAMATALDQAADQGAAQNTDPPPPPGFPYSQWGSNWAGAVGNPLEAVYYWMYDDGPGSSNIDCTASDTSGCWGHRDNVLMNLSCQMCVMGTGYRPTAWNGDPSMAELLVDSSGQPAEEFTWAQEQPYLS